MNRTFALAAMAVAMPCAAASGQTADQRVQTEIVTFADLDLRSAAHIRTLDRRILSAVQAACGSTSQVDVTGSNAARRCRKQLLAQLNAQRSKLIAGERIVTMAAAR